MCPEPGQWYGPCCSQFGGDEACEQFPGGYNYCIGGAWECDRNPCKSWQDFPGYPTPTAGPSAFDTARRVFQYHAILADGRVLSRGPSGAGTGGADLARGDGSVLASNCEPTVVPGLDGDVQWIAYAGGSRAVFWSSDGTSDRIYATGDNMSGALGISKTIARTDSPVLVAFP